MTKKPKTETKWHEFWVLNCTFVLNRCMVSGGVWKWTAANCTIVGVNLTLCKLFKVSNGIMGKKTI